MFYVAKNILTATEFTVRFFQYKLYMVLFYNFVCLKKCWSVVLFKNNSTLRIFFCKLLDYSRISGKNLLIKKLKIKFSPNLYVTWNEKFSAESLSDNIVCNFEHFMSFSGIISIYKFFNQILTYKTINFVHVAVSAITLHDFWSCTIWIRFALMYTKPVYTHSTTNYSVGIP